jgi:hypothetical protein
VITARCPALAALPTTEGYTASSAPRDLAANLLGFAATQALRVAKKAGQRVAGRAMFLAMGAVTVDVEGFLDLLRGTRAFADALARLKAMDILDPGLTPAGVRDIHVGGSSAWACSPATSTRAPEPRRAPPPPPGRNAPPGRSPGPATREGEPTPPRRRPARRPGAATRHTPAGSPRRPRETREASGPGRGPARGGAQGASAPTSATVSRTGWGNARLAAAATVVSRW